MSTQLKRITNLVNQPVKFRLTTLIPQVYHLEFKTQQDLTSTLLRFQEYYESPQFRNKIFSLPQFIAWYKTTRKGRFTYFSDWSGFNFPSSILTPFQEKKFSDLSIREQKILKTFKSHPGKFYVIGTYKSENSKNDLEVKKHEIAHALFYLKPAYQQAVLKELAHIDVRPICKYLKKLGYHPQVWLDECQAYLLTDTVALSQAKIDIKKYKPTIEKLEKLFKKYL